MLLLAMLKSSDGGLVLVTVNFFGYEIEPWPSVGQPSNSNRPGVAGTERSPSDHGEEKWNIQPSLRGRPWARSGVYTMTSPPEFGLCKCLTTLTLVNVGTRPIRHQYQAEEGFADRTHHYSV